MLHDVCSVSRPIKHTHNKIKHKELIIFIDWTETFVKNVRFVCNFPNFFAFYKNSISSCQAFSKLSQQELSWEFLCRCYTSLLYPLDVVFCITTHRIIYTQHIGIVRQPNLIRINVSMWIKMCTKWLHVVTFYRRLFCAYKVISSIIFIFGASSEEEN